MLLHVVVLALSTGMRAGEIMNLKWKDVAFDEELIFLRSSKNGEPRIIPLKGYALSLIQSHWKTHYSPERLLFVAPNNSKKPYDIRSAWRVALKRANIKDFKFHDLRHTTASYLRMKGKSLHDIGSLLGHKDARSTARYAHVSTAYKSKMVEELDQGLFGVKNE